MAQVRANLESWYNSAMDSVSAWYKRRSQFFTLGLGLALAIFANADTFAVCTALSQNKALRESLVQGAQEYEALSRQQAQAGQAPAPVVPTERWLKAKVDELAPLGLPIGWRPGDAMSPAYWAGRLP